MAYKEKVSIIIPAYNAEKTISNSINSALSQTYKNIEVIVVDDGSSDGTRDVVGSINDSRVILIAKTNSGVSASRNIGIEKSSGNYVMFCDADDTLRSDAVEKLVKLISTKEVSVVKFGVMDVIHGKPKREHMGDLSGKVVDGIKDRELLLNNFFYGKQRQKCLVMALFLQKEFIDKNKLRFDERLYMMEDVVFYADLFNTEASLFFYDMPLYNYYYREDSVSHSKKNSDRIIRGIYDANKTFSSKFYDKRINAAHFRALFRCVIWQFGQTKKIKHLNMAKEIAINSDLSILPLYWQLVGNALIHNRLSCLKILMSVLLIKDKIRKD